MTAADRHATRGTLAFILHIRKAMLGTHQLARRLIGVLRRPRISPGTTRAAAARLSVVEVGAMSLVDGWFDREPIRGNRVRGLDPSLSVALAAIVGAWITVLGVVVASPLDCHNKIDAAQVQIRSLQDAADLYRLKYGHYPADLALMIKGGLNRKPMLDSLPLDPWDHAFRWNPNRGCIRSDGPDGVSDTAEDVFSTGCA